METGDSVTDKSREPWYISHRRQEGPFLRASSAFVNRVIMPFNEIETGSFPLVLRPALAWPLPAPPAATRRRERRCDARHAGQQCARCAPAPAAARHSRHRPRRRRKPRPSGCGLELEKKFQDAARSYRTVQKDGKTMYCKSEKPINSTIPRHAVHHRVAAAPAGRTDGRAARPHAQRWRLYPRTAAAARAASALTSAAWRHVVLQLRTSS